MKTSSFKLYQGPGRISIARYAPRGTPAGFKIYSTLAPRREMLKMGYDQYRGIYFGEILEKLDPQRVWDDLHAMAIPTNAEPVLLCWETLRKPTEWCHRTMVSEWFGEQIGEQVEELRIPESG